MDKQPVSNGLQSLYTLPHNYNCKWRHRSRNSRMFIIYTSGTTGNPKGVETTFGNILAQLKDLKTVMAPIFPKKDTKILSILPMNHLFEMTVGFATFLNMGFSVYYTQSLKPKDILNIVVNYANNRTEDYFDIQIRLLSDEGNSTRINVSAVKEGESAFPYMYIDAENTDFSPKYLLRQLKQLLPDQEWRYTYMDDAEVIHNQEEL